MHRAVAPTANLVRNHDFKTKFRGRQELIMLLILIGSRGKIGGLLLDLLYMNFDILVLFWHQFQFWIASLEPARLPETQTQTYQTKLIVLGLSAVRLSKEKWLK